MPIKSLKVSKKREKSFMKKYEGLSREEIHECTQYAFNSMFLSPRFAMHLMDMAANIAQELGKFSQERAEKIKKNRKRS